MNGWQVVVTICRQFESADPFPATSLSAAVSVGWAGRSKRSVRVTNWPPSSHQVGNSTVAGSSKSAVPNWNSIVSPGCRVRGRDFEPKSSDTPQHAWTPTNLTGRLVGFSNRTDETPSHPPAVDRTSRTGAVETCSSPRGKNCQPMATAARAAPVMITNRHIETKSFTVLLPTRMPRFCQ